jgi:serine/threonine-protein kinase RsbW
MSEWVQRIADSLSVAPEAVDGYLSKFVESLDAALTEGNRVDLREFGSFVPSNPHGSTDLLVEFMSTLGESADTSRNILEAIQTGFRDTIAAGHSIEIEGLGEFKLKREKARIRRDEARGHKLIEPAQVKVAFTATDMLLINAGGELAFEANSALQQGMDSVKTSTILLVFPENDFFVQTLCYYFGRAGWKTEVVTSVDEAKTALSGAGTFLVILDAGLQQHEAFVQELKCDMDTGLIPLIIIYGTNSQVERPERVQILGDESIIQPFEVKKLLNLADAELIRASEEELIFRQQVMFQFPTVDDSIEEAVSLGEQLFEKSGLKEEEQVSLTAAFREAIGNAAQHGNKYRTERKIEVLYLLDREKITLVVKDQGSGFDHQQYVRFGQAADALSAARDRHREGKIGGLGIMLMLKCCDQIEYNHAGNSITLTKSLKPVEVAAAAS